VAHLIRGAIIVGTARPDTEAAETGATGAVRGSVAGVADRVLARDALTLVTSLEDATIGVGFTRRANAVFRRTCAKRATAARRASRPNRADLVTTLRTTALGRA